MMVGTEMMDREGSEAMIELRMAPLQPAHPPPSIGHARTDETALAFTYLYRFRRIVVGLMAVGAVVAFAEQLPALGAACVCIGIGEWIESSYYLNVLRWRRRSTAPRICNPTRSHPARPETPEL
jgi:hypothetical protein